MHHGLCMVAGSTLRSKMEELSYESDSVPGAFLFLGGIMLVRTVLNSTLYRNTRAPASAYTSYPLPHPDMVFYSFPVAAWNQRCWVELCVCVCVCVCVCLNI